MDSPKSVVETYRALLADIEHFTVSNIEPIQGLWGDYGRLDRVMGSSNGCPHSLVVKQISFPKPSDHPRGWNTDFGHQRKLVSYQVEQTWYRDYSYQCLSDFVTPKLLLEKREADNCLLVLQDLKPLGFVTTLSTHANDRQVEASIKWLAHFHAYFMGESAEGLWERGSYWHLDTRPEELRHLTDLRLKKAANAIDTELKSSAYQTLIHGDAKLANFCFKQDGSKAAAVDFQYVGKGCAMSDLALFISSAIDPKEWVTREVELLECYFTHLKHALSQYQPDLEPCSVEHELRRLYHIAWADFIRFMKGWSPEHWKVNESSEYLSSLGLKQLQCE
ncbi:phosphotransferase [Vibrio sonorensis]|uniref:phosphotransferase n=1 Tax=Vibrio sonorensis TaxID=1004316 RepID=UPI0008DA9FCA|nr:phosphotransferase [Vibrio sonorensis]